MVIRPYQKELAEKGADKLRRLGIVYYTVEVRVGKTIITLELCSQMCFDRVLFIGKKKGIDSIIGDHKAMGYGFNLTCINRESLHKVEGDFDVVVIDEAHIYGGYPKPGKFTKDVKKRFAKVPMVFLSGTPTPESYSQIFHQFWMSARSPFKEVNFYRWADTYVNKYQRHLPHGVVNFYDRAKKKEIFEVVKDYMISYTQQQAGFEVEIKEVIHEVDMKPSTMQLIEKLKQAKVIQGQVEVILADSPAKELSKVHQLCSGTVIFESGKSIVIDMSKANYIRDYFKGKKLAIFYKYKEELTAIQSVLDVTQSIDEFNTTSKSIALQIVSGREGINLSKGDAIVYYNIDFAAVSYWQSRARMITSDRKTAEVHWLFAKGGIERGIYEKVMQKKNFTTSHYVRATSTSKADQRPREAGVLRHQADQNKQSGYSRPIGRQRGQM
ncbi:MAG TPA: hypothetical protein VFV37_10980 [Luteibaculaceae bacterium]|nr:hypothetical protein [Luteibaculaceae bacterium]